jgi:hypothetical protein
VVEKESRLLGMLLGLEPPRRHQPGSRAGDGAHPVQQRHALPILAGQRALEEERRQQVAPQRQQAQTGQQARRSNRRFRPAYETFGPMRNTQAEQVKYRPPDLRAKCSENLASQRGSVSNLHCDDTLRRISVVLHRHVLVCERRRKLVELDRCELRSNTSGSGRGTDHTGDPPFSSRASSSNSQDWDLEEEEEEGEEEAVVGVEGGNVGANLRMYGGGGEVSVRSPLSRTGSALRSPISQTGSALRSPISQTGSTASSRVGDLSSPGGISRPSANDVLGTPMRAPAAGLRGSLGIDAALFENATDQLDEDLYLKSQYKYSFIRLPRLPLWTPYRMERIMRVAEVPTVERIYSFIRHLFVEAELSSECSVVCLVYVERLMERTGVELLANNWRPIVMTCMLLASKVWQDLSSWNIEFARIYPQFTVQSINRLERTILRLLQWDLFISGAVYAKYYFALRSLNESKNFRRRYNYIMRVNAPKNATNSKQLEKRSLAASSTLYSRSM